MSSSPLQTYFADLLQETKATEVVFVDDHHSPTRMTKHQFPVISQYEHEEQNKQPQRSQSSKRLFRCAKIPDFFEKALRQEAFKTTMAALQHPNHKRKKHYSQDCVKRRGFSYG
jgi:polynucleotide 5'-kinase involved in rRNA processing